MNQYIREQPILYLLGLKREQENASDENAASDDGDTGIPVAACRQSRKQQTVLSRVFKPRARRERRIV